MADALKLLIVDDCAEDREIYREYLADDPHYTYDFLEAAEADAGLSLLFKKRCDVVLLDFHMPDMTGLEFLSELSQQEQQHSVPIIMLTGQGDQSIAVQAMKQGVQDYLTKQNLQPEVLQLAIRNVVKQASLQKLLLRSQERQRLIATTALRIRQSLSLDTILSTAVSEVQQLLDCQRVGIYQCCSGSHCTVVAELGEVSDLATGIPVLIQKLETQAAGAKKNQSHLMTLKQTIAVPLVLPSQKNHAPTLWGYFVAQKDEHEIWHPDEESMLSELAIQLTTAIQQAELLIQTQEALTKAKELSGFKSQMIATVAHEYRSPLASILAAASTLRNHYEQLETLQQQRLLNMIQDKTRHLAKLVDDVLMVHECELDQTKFEPMPLNILQLLADLVEEHREQLQVHHTLSFTTSGKTAGFWGDQGLLRIALSNLLSNAIKYSPDGGEITVQLCGQTDSITILTTDQGIGIPKTDCEQLFQSFYRASNVDTIPGSGLGLAISKACIEIHSGEIYLESRENEGTKVTIQLPKKSSAVTDLYSN